jgi:hypothetical protein
MGYPFAQELNVHRPATKRQKEQVRLERRQNKNAAKAQRKAEKATRAPSPEGVDPDIADIVPGPQPVPME